MTSNTELAKNFIKNHNIKNFQQLNELMREFYYARGENKTELIKKYGSEDLTAFNWLQKQYIKGKQGKLKSLFVEVINIPLPGIGNLKLNVVAQNIGRAMQKDPESMIDRTHKPSGNINGWSSTRHKANPENTHYSKPNSPQKQFEQTSTTVPEFKSVEDIFVTYFTPAEEEIIKQQEITKQDIINCYMTPLISPDVYLPKQELPSTDYKLKLNQAEISYHHLIEFYEKLDTEKLKRILLDDIHINKRNAINHILRSRELKVTQSGINASAGKKESEGKLFYEFDWEFIEACAKRMQNNKGKYNRFNWQKPMDVEELKQSLFRHVIEIMKGNYNDGEDELGHLTAVVCNAQMVNWQVRKNSQKIREIYQSIVAQ